MNKLNFLGVVILLMLMSCQLNEESMPYKSGDILFRGKAGGVLSEAIDAVTQTEAQNHYTHMGVVEVKEDTVWVLHAAPVKGVCKELLADFCLPDEHSVIVGHYRIWEIGADDITLALQKANQELGQSYNYSYIMEDEGFYCSEYVYEIFAQNSVFKLNPMTFINPQSGDFHSGWIKHYNELGIDIPEGKPGCNPNGMAANEKLEFLGIVK